MTMPRSYPPRERIEAGADRLYRLAREMSYALGAEHGTHDPTSCNVAALVDAWRALDDWLETDASGRLHEHDAMVRKLEIAPPDAYEDIRNHPGVYR